MVRQKLTGKGIAIIQAGGTVLEKTLGEGESIYIDQMSLVAWSSSIKVNVSPYAGVFGCFTQCCGGESCYMMKLTGMKLEKGKTAVRRCRALPRVAATVHTSALRQRRRAGARPRYKSRSAPRGQSRRRY